VAGFCQRGTTAFDFLVVRLNRDGTLDPSFAGGAGFQRVDFALGGTQDDRAPAVALQDDGQIVVAGFAATPARTDLPARRLNVDGTLAATFDSDGKQPVPFALGGGNLDVANDLVLQSDHRIVVVGSATTAADGTNFAACRLNEDGGLDNNFDSDGKVTVGV